MPTATFPLSFRCRRFFIRLVAASNSTVVSKTGPLTPSQPSPTTKTAPLHTNHAFVVVVIALAVSVLVCMCAFILLFRRGREGASNTVGDQEVDDRRLGTTREQQHVEIDTRHVNKAGFFGEEEDGEGFEGKRRRRKGVEVELVVMAGEEVPTFLAHPAPAQDKGKAVGCPPMQL